MPKPTPPPQDSIEKVKARHELRLLQIEDVQGVGITDDRGRPAITIYVSKKTRKIQERLPKQLDGYPVTIEVSGEFEAS